MKSYSVLALLLGLWVSLSSCEDVVDVELEKSKPVLVVDGWITDQPGPQTIRLKTTAPYFSNGASPVVTGATVTIRDNQGQTEVLKETAPGVYQTQSLRGKVGNQYTLTVKTGSEEYTAETAIRRTFPIDSIGTVYQKESMGRKEGYTLRFYGREPLGVGDSYRLKVYRNDTLLNSPHDLIFLEDRYVDGNYFKGLDLGLEPFRKGDKVRIENHSITEDTYAFLTELSTQMRNGGMFANPPANVRSNIKAVQGGKKATGWFGGSAVSSAERVVE
ncbi:hypothetical protein GCM10023187_32440 [Nibrella viscosa]|uniref:DUF4249 domain-containing protein n=1 Tax=Nibrella viscosa TaxID=1084524 RepID=A0ABP8KKI5_9BACT